MSANNEQSLTGATTAEESQEVKDLRARVEGLSAENAVLREEVERLKGALKLQQENRTQQEKLQQAEVQSIGAQVETVKEALKVEREGHKRARDEFDAAWRENNKRIARADALEAIFQPQIEAGEDVLQAAKRIAAVAKRGTK